MNRSANRQIILITDGYDENSQSKFDDAVDAVKRARATVYSVGIGGITLGGGGIGAGTGRLHAATVRPRMTHNTPSNRKRRMRLSSARSYDVQWNESADRVP
jgi:hypothetical protein